MHIKDFTVANIHKQIRESASHSQAATRLGVWDETLARHLGKYLYRGHPMTFKVLNELSIADARAYWGKNYYQPLQPYKVNINQYTVAYIHSQVRAAKSTREAASSLGVGDRTLASHLSKFFYKDQPLTFTSFKALSVKDAQANWPQNYFQPMQASRIDIKKYTAAQIHQQLHQAGTTREAANLLGTSDHTLARHLGKFIYNGKPLSFLRFKNLSVSEATAAWGERYNQPMQPSPINIKKYTMAYIHEQVLDSVTASEAASRLGLTHSTLTTHLGKFLYKGEPLTFTVFKNLSVAEARAIWKKKYEEPIKSSRIDLKKYKISYIHEQIRRASTIREAASFLGVTDGALIIYMGQLRYKGQPLNYNLFKQITLTEANATWGSHYHHPLQSHLRISQKHNYAFIHEQVLRSHTAREAAGYIGVSDSTLSNYLKKLSYQGQPLTYSLFKQISVTEAISTWGSLYQQHPHSISSKRCRERDCSEAILKTAGEQRLTNAGTLVPSANHRSATDETVNGNKANFSFSTQGGSNFFTNTESAAANSKSTGIFLNL